MNTINITMPVESAKLLIKVLRIAEKAHDFNPSPVHIKEELSELDPNQIKLLREGLSEAVG